MGTKLRSRDRRVHPWTTRGRLREHGRRLALPPGEGRRRTRARGRRRPARAGGGARDPIAARVDVDAPAQAQGRLRARRGLMDLMEEQGIVGPSRARRPATCSSPRRSGRSAAPPRCHPSPRLGHDELMRLASVLFAGSMMLAACADPPGTRDPAPASSADDVPLVAEIVCEADGSTTVSTPEVLVQPDGVHVRVLSRLDEPARSSTFAMDVEPGETDRVVGQHLPPGRSMPAAIRSASTIREDRSRIGLRSRSSIPRADLVDGEVECGSGSV